MLATKRATSIDLGDDAAVAHELLPRLYGDRGHAFLMGPHRPSLRVFLGPYHLAKSSDMSPGAA